MHAYTIFAWNTSSFDVAGPDPFLDQDNRNSAAINATQITLKSDAVGAQVQISDDDPQFHDPRFEYAGPQTLASNLSLAGSDFTAGESIGAEYRYVIRPTGSTNTADNISIIVFRIGGTIIGVASTAPLVPGLSYTIRSGGEDHPSPFYSTLVSTPPPSPICFTPATRIDTPSGPRPVAALRVGDLVLTRDGGARHVLWVGGGPCAGQGNRAPVLVRAGRLGNARDLLLSPNHRVLVGRGAEEGLVAVKALVDGDGVRLAPRPCVVYLHLLLDGHHLVSAEGAPVESLWPGAEALASLAPEDAAAVGRALSGDGTRWTPARTLLRPGRWRRAQGFGPIAAPVPAG